MWAIRLPRCSTAHRLTDNAAVSCGVISYTPTQIIYEGDLDGSGTVYRVYVQLQPGPGGTCPCTLQRGAVRKSDALAGTVPTYFTEVNGVLNSGNGLGGATYAISLPVQDRTRPTARQTYSMPTMWAEVGGHLHHDLGLLQHP